MVGIELGFGRRLELITTMTRVTRIPLLALFFVSVVDFSLDNARIDLLVMTAALAMLLWGGLRKPWLWGANCGVLWPQPFLIHEWPCASHAPPNVLATRGAGK